MLIRLGTGFLGLALLASLWASPDRLASLPWFIISFVGVVMVLVVTGRLLPIVAHKVRAAHIVGFFVTSTFISLGAALLTSRWPSYKLSWLNSIYAFLPSIRSLPFWWTQQGLQPNQTGGMLAVCSAFAAALALSSWRSGANGFDRAGEKQPSYIWRWTGVLLAVAGVIVVFITGSRAALAGLALAVLLVLILKTRRWLWGWGAGLAVLAVGLFASGKLTTIFHFFVHDETLDTKVIARLDIWSSVLRGIQDHPLTGIGLGVFNKVMPVRYPYQTVGLSYPVTQAHNLFLDVALAIGLPGVLGLALLLVGCILLAIQGLRVKSMSRVASLGILASMVAFLTFGVTDQISFSIPTSFLVWLWACSLAIIHARAEQNIVSGE